MKKLITVLVGTIALGTTLSAFAGPDWQAIEQARKNARAQENKTEKSLPADKCAEMRLVLPLDHGPRAQSTPFLNRQREEAFNAELKACQAAGKSGMTQAGSAIQS